MICNPVTEEIGALDADRGAGRRGRRDAGGDLRARVATPPSRRARSPRRWPPPTWCWRRRSSRSPTPRRAKRRATPGVRIATLPGVTEEMLARLMNGDLDEMRRRGWAIVNALNAGSEARITCRNGSDLRFSTRGARGDRRRGRTHGQGRLRQPALRRGLHRPGRRDRRGHAGGRRLDRRDRPGRVAGPPDRRGRPPHRRDRRPRAPG